VHFLNGPMTRPDKHFMVLGYDEAVIHIQPVGDKAKQLVVPWTSIAFVEIVKEAAF
jgi:hypothetical protein